MRPRFLDDLFVDRISVGGRSYPNGFDISFSSIATHHSWHMGFRALQSEYPDRERIDWAAVVVIPLSIVIAIWFHVWLLAMVLLSYSLKEGTFYRGYKGWHWCEHQVTQLLEQNQIPSEGLLRSQTPVTVRCGSVMLACLNLAALAPSAMAFHVALEEWLAALICFLLMISGACGLAFYNAKKIYWLVRFFKSPRLVRIMCWVGIPAFVIGMTLERLCFLRKPSALQSEYALKWGCEASTFIAIAILKDAVDHVNRLTPPPAQ